MSRKRITVLIVGISVTIMLAWQQGAELAPTNTIVVHGTVQDSRGKLLAGVLVEVWRAGKSESVTTASDGSYKLVLDSGPQIDQIRYTRSDMDPAVVDRLSGTREQQIAKILYPTGTLRSLKATYEQLHAFESIAVVALSAPIEFRPLLVENLRNMKFQSRINALPIPQITPGQTNVVELLASRKEQIQKLYVQQGW